MTHSQLVCVLPVFNGCFVGLIVGSIVGDIVGITVDYLLDIVLVLLGKKRRHVFVSLRLVRGTKDFWQNRGSIQSKHTWWHLPQGSPPFKPPKSFGLPLEPTPQAWL